MTDETAPPKPSKPPPRTRMRPNYDRSIMRPTQVWLPPSTRAALAILEESEHRVMSDIIREAIDRFIAGPNRRWVLDLVRARQSLRTGYDAGQPSEVEGE